VFQDRLMKMQRVSTISYLHDKNIISVIAWPCMQTDGMSWLMTSSADRTLKLVDPVHGVAMATLFDGSLENQGSASAKSLPHRSPILVINVHPQDPMLILTASMDGSHALSRVQMKEDGGALLECLQAWQDHRKYIVRAQFSPDGHWMATASYDKTLRVYVDVEYTQQQLGMSLPAGHNGSDRYRLAFSQTYQGTVEGLCFMNAQPLSVVVSVRDDNYLHYYHLPSFEEHKYNMNASGDDVVSFTAMHLSPSPCPIDGQSYVLVATDQENGRSILFRAHSDRQVRQFYGVQIDGYSQPRHCWLPDASHFFATSDADHAVWVYRLSDGKCVRKLGGVDVEQDYSGQGHRGIVRDMIFDQHIGTLVTASYDQTVALWR
jgi:COMPASS component SWD3